MARKEQRRTNGGSASNRARVAELEAELSRLREAAGATDKHTLESWATLPEEIRDRFAASALFSSKGNHKAAMTLLGFNREEVLSMSPEQWVLVRTAIFDTPGMRAQLARDFADLEANKATILARMSEVALHSDDDAAVRAAQFLSRVAGWEQAPKGPAVNVNINLHELISGAQQEPKRVTTHEQAALSPNDPLAIFSHEPGEPVKIDYSLDLEKER